MKSTGRRRAIGPFEQEDLDQETFSNFALSRTHAAYQRHFSSYRTFTSVAIYVRTLVDGRVVRRLDAFPDDTSDETRVELRDLVVSDSGWLAWIVEVEDANGRRTQVRKVDGAGEAVLEESALIEPRSLTISGSTVVWRSGGTRRASVLSS